jgi:hypothetical protein
MSDLSRQCLPLIRLGGGNFLGQSPPMLTQSLAPTEQLRQPLLSMAYSAANLVEHVLHLFALRRRRSVQRALLAVDRPSWLSDRR